MLIVHNLHSLIFLRPLCSCSQYIVNDDAFAYLQITYSVTEPIVAFTGDTTSDFIVDNSNVDVLKARILVMEVDCLLFAYDRYYQCPWNEAVL